MHFSTNSRSSGQPNKRRKHIFSPTLHPLYTVIFATATVLAFVLLRDSRFNFHCYTQREARHTQKSARKCAATYNMVHLLSYSPPVRFHSPSLQVLVP